MINNKKVYAIILARSGSKAIKDKNLTLINGKSLLQRAIDVCKESEYIDKIYVSSDSEEYLKIAEQLGAHPILRPNSLAQDTSSSSSTVLHFLENVKEKPDYIVESMCTCPFKTAANINSCLEKISTGKYDAVVTVARVQDHHPARVKYIKDEILCDFFPEKKESRRQDLEPKAYVRCGGIYVFKLETILTYGSRYGGVVGCEIIDDFRAINIDEPIDLKMAELIGEEYGL